LLAPDLIRYLSDLAVSPIWDRHDG
jgi:hypothetical protein